MEEPKNIAPQDALNSSFRSEKIFDSSPEELKRLLCALGTYDLNREQDRSKAVIRALTINHIQMAGVIRDLNIQNGITATAVKRLTVLGIVLAALQVFCAGFFIWRDFHPRDIPVNEPPVSREAERKTSPHKDESPRPVEPIPK